MTQEVVHDFPPIYSEIAAVFRIHERRDIIFSFGSCIYNPHGVWIAPEIAVHEAIHGVRQGTGQQVLDWWQRYMESQSFRLTEEIYAHRAEYRWLCENGDRRERRRACKRIANKLASPLYGQMITPGAARKALKETPHAGH